MRPEADSMGVSSLEEPPKKIKKPLQAERDKFRAILSRKYPKLSITEDYLNKYILACREHGLSLNDFSGPKLLEWREWSFLLWSIDAFPDVDLDKAVQTLIEEDKWYFLDSYAGRITGLSAETAAKLAGAVKAIDESRQWRILMGWVPSFPEDAQMMIAHICVDKGKIRLLKHPKNRARFPERALEIVLSTRERLGLDEAA